MSVLETRQSKPNTPQKRYPFVLICKGGLELAGVVLRGKINKMIDKMTLFFKVEEAKSQAASFTEPLEKHIPCLFKGMAGIIPSRPTIHITHFNLDQFFSKHQGSVVYSGFVMTA